MSRIRSHNLVVIGTDCIGNCKSNFHTITTSRDFYFSFLHQLNVTITMTEILFKLVFNSRNPSLILNYFLTYLIFDFVLLQSQFTHDIPDGHKAPCPDLINRGSSTRSVDTQTPGNLSDNSSGSRSHSVSPAIPIMPGHVDTSRPSSDSSPRRPSSDSSPRRPSSDYSTREMEKGIVFFFLALCA